MTSLLLPGVQIPSAAGVSYSVTRRAEASTLTHWLGLWYSQIATFWILDAYAGWIIFSPVWITKQTAITFKPAFMYLSINYLRRPIALTSIN